MTNPIVLLIKIVWFNGDRVGRRRTKMRSSALGRSGRGTRTLNDTSSKTIPRMENKSRRGSRDRSSDSHRRHSPFEEVDSSERSFRESSERDDFTIQEADVGGDVDVDVEGLNTWKASDSAETGMTVMGGMDEGDEGDAWYGESEAEDEIYPGEAPPTCYVVLSVPCSF